MTSVIVIEITDATGRSMTAVTDESSSVIQLWGTDANGQHQSFDSEAYHSSTWAAKHGFKRRVHAVKLDLELQRSTDWQVHDD